jgi:N-acetylglucosamine malate deacetylase 2
MTGPGQGEAFLARLAGDEILPGRNIAVVVAHADDETIGIGAQLARMPGVTIVQVTDSAPKNAADARAKGFATSAAYAAARRREAEAAAALAGVPAESLVGLGVGDQEAAFHLAAIARRLGALLRDRGIGIVFTHVYEGGHPDHDAVAYGVHRAARIIAREGVPAPIIVEMPLYHAGREGWVLQRFCDERGPSLSVWLDDFARDLKERQVAAHASQRDVLALFPIVAERFRIAPDHDFSVLPNGGELLYERYPWGLTGARWLAEVARADADLGYAR